MSATANGVAHSEILEIGELTEDTTTVSITRQGQKQLLTAYLWGDGVTLGLQEDVARARRTYFDYLRQLGTDENFSNLAELTQGQREQINVAVSAYHRDVLKILIPDLTLQEADILAGDYDRYRPILQRLKFLSLAAEQPQANPQQAGESPADSTTPKSSRTSRTGTASAGKKR
jgi:hypothetical protein